MSRNKPIALSLAIFLSAACVACGETPNPGPATNPDLATNPDSGSKADRTKAALHDLFTKVRAGDNAGAAGRIVYRGRDKEREWKTLCDYTEAGDKARVDAIAVKMMRYLALTDAPEFLVFRSERESEGEWLVWKVKLGPKTADYACLDIGGTIALGDID